MTAPSFDSNDDVDVPASPQADSGSGNIKVAVRLCPIWEDDKGSRKRRRASQDSKAWCVEFDGKMASMIQKGHSRKVEGRTVFHFDRVFDEDTQTPLVYEGIVRPMVPAVLNGKHATIFAYGQTGSGKTYTMQGGENVETGQGGIIQLVAKDLFQLIRNDEARKFEVKVSYFEIYNERIRDLLDDDEREVSSNEGSGHRRDRSSNNDSGHRRDRSSNSSSAHRRDRSSNSSSAHRREPINVRTNERGEVVVNVAQKTVKNVGEALTMLVQGNARRTVAATDMNAHSSRSHSVFRLSVESRTSIDEDQPIDSMSGGLVRVSDFNLVDLAGSESLKTAKTTGIRQREGATINKSLLALTSVIQALSQPTKKKPQHINYRDSKLTRILQPHLSGNADMAILCCASRSKNFVEETRSTLKFASRAKLVRMKPKINEVVDDSAIIKNLQDQLIEVRKQLEMAEKKLQKEQARQPIVVKSTPNDQKAAISSAAYSDIIADKNDQTATISDIIADKNDFQKAALSDVTAEKRADEADLGVAKKSASRHRDSFDPFDLMSSSQASTANSSTEYDRSNEKMPPSIQKIDEESYNKSESCDSPVTSDDDSFYDAEDHGPDISINVCSQVSNPETIRGTQGVDHREKSAFGPQVSKAFSPNGRLEKDLSCDATALSTNSLAQSGRPLQAIESIHDERKYIIPDEIAIIDSGITTGNNMCLMDQLKDYEARIQFLEEKLEVSDNVIEANFRDLQRARLCIRDLVQRNVEMNVELNRKRREDAKLNYEIGEIMVEQYWVLKASVYGGVFFLLSGAHEFFLGAAFFVWLALETNLRA